MPGRRDSAPVAKGSFIVAGFGTLRAGLRGTVVIAVSMSALTGSRLVRQHRANW